MRAVDTPVATDLQAELSSPAAVRKALLARGWDLAWIDGVTGEMIKRKLQASVPQIEAAVRVSLGREERSRHRCVGSGKDRNALARQLTTGSGVACMLASHLRAAGGNAPLPPCRCGDPCALPLLSFNKRASLRFSWRVQVSYLESLGIPLKSVENMVSINKLVRAAGAVLEGMDAWRLAGRAGGTASHRSALRQLTAARLLRRGQGPTPRLAADTLLQILGQPVDAMRAVVEYAQRQGASGEVWGSRVRGSQWPGPGCFRGGNPVVVPCHACGPHTWAGACCPGMPSC